MGLKKPSPSSLLPAPSRAAGSESRAATLRSLGVKIGARLREVASCWVRAPTWSLASRATPVLFGLNAIHGLENLDEPGAPPPEFDLSVHAERSFGLFQEEPLEVAFRFAPSAAPDARTFLFCPPKP
jgi:hypothetical protein